MAAKTKGSKKAQRIHRNIGEPPRPVWQAILGGNTLSLNQCREGAAWAFSKMPRSRRILAMFDLIERTYKLGARERGVNRG